MSTHLMLLAAALTVAASSAVAYSIGYASANLAARETETPAQTPEGITE